MKKVLFAMIAAALSGAVFAQGPDEGDGGPDRGRRGNGDRPRGMGNRSQRGGGFGMMRMPDARGDAEKELAKKFPAEYEALLKERNAVEEKLQALAKKAEVTLPDADFVRREKLAAFEKKYEKELKEIEELQKTDFRAAMQKRMELMKKEGLDMGFGRGMGRGPRDGMGGSGGPGGMDAPKRGNPREMMEQMIKDLKAKYPAEYAEYEKLKKDDPSAARDYLRRMARKLRDQGNPPPPPPENK